LHIDRARFHALEGNGRYVLDHRCRLPASDEASGTAKGAQEQYVNDIT
jgi:hypothetical protein